MNVERMEKLAKYIETRPTENFDMNNWIGCWCLGGKEAACEADILNSCGTTCCIAGWAPVMEGFCLDSTGGVYDGGAYIGHARSWTEEFLDLSPYQGSSLFYDQRWEDEFLPATPQTAAAKIRQMIQTSEQERELNEYRNGNNRLNH